MPHTYESFGEFKLLILGDDAEESLACVLEKMERQTSSWLAGA